MPTAFAEIVTRARVAQSRWAETPIPARREVVRRLRHALTARAQDLCLTTTQDLGRPADEVLSTDILPVADGLKYLERHGGRLLKPRRISSSTRPWWLQGQRETIYRRPRGVIGIVGTWNYPILLNAITIAQAIFAGNAVIWKPSELTPILAERLHELFLEVGVPPDLLARLPATREAGPQLIEADIDHLVFTGSATVGRKIAARLGERLISSTLELSGCDALFVLEDANVPLAAQASWFAATLNSGQTCLAIRRAFVHRSRYEEYLAVLRTLAGEPRPVPLTLMGQARQAESLIREALSRGAKPLFGDFAGAADDPPRVAPTVVFDADPEMAICREASFAPILAVIPFDSNDELATLSEKCPYGLGASVFTAQPDKARDLAARLRVGSVAVNDTIVGTAHPAIGFGGVRESGWGVTRGEEGLLSLTVPQVLTTRGGSFRPHYRSEDPRVHGVLRGLLHWCHAGSGRDRRAGFRGMLRAAWRFVTG